jgi:hypothetical protein
MEISRRTVLAAAAMPLTGVAAACAARAGGTMYVTPDGAGDGASWDSAAPLRAIGDLIEQAKAAEVLVAADRGEYALRDVIEISGGGRSGAAVRVRGVNSATGEPMPAVIRGDRANAEGGSEAFRLLRGADHLHFSHFDFRAIGNGCFRVGAPIAALTIEDCGFQDIYRFVENGRSGNETQASINRFAIRRCRGAGVERGFLRIRYASRDGLVEDCRAEGLANEGGDIPAGCALDDRANNIVYRRCVMENFQQWRAGDYWNGDGYSDEEENHSIRYEACEARGSTDGGFDCKSRDVVLDRCVAEDNKRNFRVWSRRATLTNCTSRNPNFRGRDVEDADACHVWIGGEGARLVVSGLSIEDQDATAILEFEHDDAQAMLRSVTINAPRENWGDTSISRNGAVITARQD